MKSKIYLIDDDISFSKDLASFLQQLNYDTQQAFSLKEAESGILDFQPDILLLDVQLPDGNGVDFLDFVKQHLPGLIVVMLSGYGSISIAIQAIKKGAEDFLSKPINPEHLKIYLEKLIERKQLKNILRLRELEERGQMFIGPSPQIKTLLEQARTAARSEAIVLLQGETGTGKQLLARYIHEQSPRSAGPFVYVNCATLSETLIESDLFGHEKGAFTGAHQMKQGRVELAHGGTLFLDEIAELPVNLQAKLLHFIEYGQFQRVGGSNMLKSNARVICATNKDLETMVQQQRFRQDLFFRINIITLRIPPLRERPEDILPFVEFFLEKFASDLKKTKPELSDALKQKLKSYYWPGNIRELRNAIERAVILAEKPILSEKDFSFLQAPTIVDNQSLFSPRPLSEAINAFKKEYLRQVLKHTAGNQTQAAKILQIQRTYLNRLLQDLKVEDKPGDQTV